MEHEIVVIDFAERTDEVLAAVMSSGRSLIHHLDSGYKIIRADVVGTMIIYILEKKSTGSSTAGVETQRFREAYKSGGGKSDAQ